MECKGIVEKAIPQRPRSSRLPLALCPLLAALPVLLAPRPAAAATLTVTNTHDNLAGSLRQAILDANSGDTVTFAIPTGDAGYNATTGVYTITLTGGELAIGKNFTITGAANKIVLQRSSAGGTPEFRIFDITAGVVSLTNLTMSGGDVELQAAGAPSDGGGVYNAGQLTMRNCTLVGDGGGRGGGFFNAATATVTNCTFAGNNSQFNGGGGIFNAGSLTVDSCTVSGNNENGSVASGILNDVGGTAHIRNTIITGNTHDGGPSPNNAYGTFISDGYNLIGDGGSGFGGAGSHDQVGTSANPGNAGLGPLTG